MGNLPPYIKDISNNVKKILKLFETIPTLTFFLSPRRILSKQILFKLKMFSLLNHLLY